VPASRRRPSPSLAARTAGVWHLQRRRRNPEMTAAEGPTCEPASARSRRFSGPALRASLWAVDRLSSGDA
jgi:hypothetical protein